MVFRGFDPLFHVFGHYRVGVVVILVYFRRIDDTLLNKVSAQQDIAAEFGKRTVTWAGDLQEVAAATSS